MAILPTTNTEKITQDIALLFAVDFGHILVRAHLGNKLVAVSFLKLRKNTLLRKLNRLKAETVSDRKVHKLAKKMAICMIFFTLQKDILQKLW